MAVELYATNRFPGDGTTTQYEINFSGGYMDKSHVKAYIEDPETLAREDLVITSSMFVGPYTINVGVSTPVGKTFVIYRDTPKDEPLVDFVNGSRVTEQNLDKVARQAVLGLAEVFDASNAAVVAEFTAAAQNVVDAKDDAIAAGSASQAAQAAAEAAQAAAVAAKDDAQDIADSINPSQFALATELSSLASSTTTALAGKLSTADGAVGTSNLADGFLAATTAGRAKMADLFVTTAKLADAAVTQAKLAANVAGTGPAFSAYQSSTQSFSAGTWTKVQLQTEEFDTNNNFDSTTNYRFTPTVAGYYQFAGSLYLNAGTVLICALYKNGSQAKTGSYLISTAAVQNTCAGLIYMNGSTDYVELYGFNNVGGTSGNLQAATCFQGFLARAA